MSPTPWLTPDWRVPTRVGAVMSTRLVALDHALRHGPEMRSVRPVHLRQVHGSAVLDLDACRVDPESPEPEWRAWEQSLASADAAVTTRPGVACTVRVADCLPVLLADSRGRGVAAAHAGWRGLAAGVLEATVSALCRATGGQPAELLAWLGPCIRAHAFEVGVDVLEAFGRNPSQCDARFVWSPRADGSARWRADLPGLAQDRLRAAGLAAITDSGLCTFSDESRFFSFRRDGQTGRMAASVWLRA